MNLEYVNCFEGGSRASVIESAAAEDVEAKLLLAIFENQGHDFHCTVDFLLRNTV